MKRFALRELSTVINEGDKNISRLGAMLKMLAISVDQIEHKIVHDRENRTNLANAVDTRADDVDQLGGSAVTHVPGTHISQTDHTIWSCS